MVFWSLLCYKKLKRTTKLYRSSTSQHSNPNSRFGHGFKSDTVVLTFTFCFLSSPLFLPVFPHFFSLAGHLVALFLWERFYGKPVGS